MLGLLLTREVTRNMPEVDPADLDAAANVGFTHAEQGEEGIRAALQVVHDRVRAARILGGPHQTFGFFHAWLRTSGDQLKPAGPIRDITRAFILDQFAIAEGTDHLGEVIRTARKHTVHTLARKIGTHPTRVQRALVYAGMLEGHPERPSHHIVFDAAPAEALFARMVTALSQRDLRKYLNCTRTRAERLVRAGILPRVSEQENCGRNTAQHISREAVDAFLRSLIGRACRVEQGNRI